MTEVVAEAEEVAVGAFVPGLGERVAVVGRWGRHGSWSDGQSYADVVGLLLARRQYAGTRATGHCIRPFYHVTVDQCLVPVLGM